MGRNFKTSEVKFIDNKMFQLPAELMYKVLTGTDANIDKQIETVNAFDDKLKVENIDSDDAAVNAKKAYYRDKIKSYTEGILKKPLDYGKFQLPIMETSRELSRDINEGIFGKAAEQKKKLADEIKRITDLKDVSEERKGLIISKIKKDYAANQGLNYKGPSDYTSIDKFFIDPYNDVEVDKFINEIGTNFIADKESKAWAYSSSPGYISEGTLNTEERKVAEIEAYTKDKLALTNWEAQQRQLLELRKDIKGEIFRDANGNEISIDQQLINDKNKIIDMAKQKLGYKQESKTASLKSDSTALAREGWAQSNKNADGSNIFTETIDLRTAYGINTQKTFAHYNKTIAQQKIANADGTGSYDNYEQVKDALKKGTETVHSLTQKMKKVYANVNPVTVANFINYMNDEQKWFTPHQPNYNPNDATQKASQVNYLNTLVTGINEHDINEPIKEIRIRTTSGTQKMPYNTIGQLLHNDGDYIYFPAEALQTTNAVKRTPAGYLADKNGIALSENGKNFKTVQEAIDAGIASQIVSDPQTIINTNKTPIVATFDNIRQHDKLTVNGKNQVFNNTEYIVPSTLIKADKTTGKIEVVTVHAVYDANKVGVNINH